MKNLIFDSVVLETKLYWIGFSTSITNKIGGEKLKFKKKSFLLKQNITTTIFCCFFYILNGRMTEES